MLSNLFEFLFCPMHGVVWQAGPCVSQVVVQVVVAVRSFFSRR